MRGSSRFERQPLNPDRVDGIGRAAADLFRRLMGRRRDGREPTPLPPPLPDLDATPRPDEPPDRRTDQCVGDCEENNRCPVKTFCFNKMRFIGTPKEPVYDSQLAVQEATMRTMSPGQVLQNRERFETIGRRSLEAFPEVRQAKSAVVEAWLRRNPTLDYRSLGYHALHRLDMVAGGVPHHYYDLGDGRVNSSIGGSWSRSKLAALDQHARNLQANYCPLMAVRFDSSPACVNDHIPPAGYPE